MENGKLNKRRISMRVLSLVFFASTFIVEILIQTLPKHTSIPQSTENILIIFRSIFLVCFAICFTLVLFPLFEKRFGKLKAVFFTIYSDCFIGFLIGILITTLAGSQNSISYGITPLESIYYYFLGIFVMLISVLIVLIGMITYAILQGVINRKMKKHGRNG